jgi:hypothetical protein
MLVWINRKEISIFAGARIRDAVLAYSKEAWKAVENGELSIVDRAGSLTDSDGPISEGQSFTLIKTGKL